MGIIDQSNARPIGGRAKQNQSSLRRHSTITRIETRQRDKASARTSNQYNRNASNKPKPTRLQPLNSTPREELPPHTRMSTVPSAHSLERWILRRWRIWVLKVRGRRVRPLRVRGIVHRIIRVVTHGCRIIRLTRVVPRRWITHNVSKHRV